MKVTVFNGSPAGPASATNVMASAFLEGAAQAGAETENIYLKDYHLIQCQGCFSCWFQNPGVCALSDDMEPLLKLYNESDLICFGTPVYTWNMTGLLKNFADRLVPLKCPHITEKDGNYDLQDSRARTQKIVILSNCGFPGENNFDVMRAAVACCNPCLEIYRNCGKLLKSKDPDILKTVGVWLQSVKQAGAEMVLEGQISDATDRALNMPLMKTEDYIKFLGM